MRTHVSRSTVWWTAVRLLVEVVGFGLSSFRSQTQLAAENLFLRKQLALFRERQVKPRRPDDATRITLVVLSHLIDWRAVLTIVRPDTLIRWHRKGFRLFWRLKSRAPGRPPLPLDVQHLIAAMARANVTWERSELPRNCASSLAFACRHGRCGATCHRVGGRGAVCRRSTGAPLCATMQGRCSPAISS
jgi:hypothetical protein